MSKVKSKRDPEVKMRKIKKRNRKTYLLTISIAFISFAVILGIIFIILYFN